MSELPTTGFCCEALAAQVEGHSGYAGGGFLYPDSMRPTGQIERTGDGHWHVNGCCGGGCYVLTDIQHCPYCGSKLPSQPDEKIAVSA